MDETNLSMTKLAEKLGVSRASLYYKPKKPKSDEEIKEKIIAVMKDNKAYGHRRVAIALKINHKKTKRIMKKFGLRPKLRRRYRQIKPDDVNKPEIKALNILKILHPLALNVVWAGDFTYIKFQGRFWYVATVIDIFTREIIGWNIGNHHTAALIIGAFEDAVRRTKATPKYFHSDQGSEYVSEIYCSILDKYNVIKSLSTKAKPWQNGFQESFYNNFKLELGKASQFENIGKLIEAIYQQLEYYNKKRIHTSLKMAPMEFKILNQKIYVTNQFMPVLYTNQTRNCV